MTDNAPESWKIKCGIRHPDAVGPMTDGGTLIMREGPMTRRRAQQKTETQPLNRSSLAPFALDVVDHEDNEPLARNHDAFGTVRRTTASIRYRSTTNTSFWSGLAAGLATLGVGAAIAFTALTAEPNTAYGTSYRSRHLVTHVAKSLSVETAELVEAKATKKKTPRVHRPVAAPREAAPEAEAQPTPEPSETE